MLTIAAFDPGNSPSAAVYWGNDKFLLFAPMGVEREITRRRRNEDGIMKPKKGKTHVPDIPAILDIFRAYLPDIVVIEQVSAMSTPVAGSTTGERKGQGLASTASLMESCGLLKGIGHGVSLNGVTRVVTIRPQEWRAAWAMPKGKEQSRLVAARLFPSRARDFKLVASHQVADPLLMAMVVWHRETGVPLPR